MAGNTVYKVGIVISADAAAVKPGVASAKAEIASIGTEAVQTQTKMQQLIATATGLHVGAANGNTRAWSGALAAEGLAADNLRAKYLPLVAVMQQYRAAQTEIRTAHAMGILSTDEMTAALQRQKTAAQSAMDAIKGRNTVATANNGNNFAATNLMFQMQDIGMTAAMGMNPAMIALQQGSQVAGAVAGMSLKQTGATLLSAFTQLLSPVSLAAVAVTGLSAAAIQYFTKSKEGADELGADLREQADLIASVANAWGDATPRIKAYADEMEKAAKAADRLKTGETIAKAQYTPIEDTLSSLRQPFSAAQRELSGYGADAAPALKLMSDAVTDLQSKIGAGTATTNDLSETQQALAKTLDLAGTPAVRRFVDEFAKVAPQIQAAVEAARQFRQEGSGSIMPELGQLGGRFSEGGRLYAPEDFMPRGNVPVPTQRPLVELEGLPGAVEAEKALTEARRDRIRSLDDSIASQQLELSLIGRTISETEALRMQYQLTAQLKADAAKNGVAVDQDELRLIEEKSRAYGRLAEQIAATNAVREQDQTILHLQTELSLVGASDDARRRALATLEAEQRIKQLGINASSAEAQQIRERASAISELTEQLRRQNEAWNKVRGSAENTIDSMVDGLVDGDISGALESIAKDITSTFLELSVKNPLKNALLGTSYGTLGDVGGLGGIVSKLFGGGDVSAIGGAGAVGSMSVQAGSVMVNGSVVGSAMSALGVDRMFNAANGNAATAAGGSDIQSQIWNFFAGKGLQSHQIAGIMGNINAESAFNPLAVGDSGNALGLFQHNDRASALLAAIGGQGNLGNVGSQLDFAWNELNTSERASLQRLLASTDVRGATSAFAGFERPRGWSLSNPEGADNYVGRLKGAEAALERFGNTTTTATQGLGTLGSGFDQFGRNLTNWFPAAPSGGGGLGGLLGGLFGGGLSSYGQSVFGSSAQFASAWQAGGAGLYSGGGYTGAGGVYEPRGIVHAGEVVWSQADVARHGGVSNVEAMRTGARFSGYASGGAVGVSPLPYAANASQFIQREERMPSLQIINQTSTPITGEVQEGQDEGGRRQSRLIISDEMGAAAQQKGGGFQKAMSRQYGLRPRGIPR